jgi:hypothetical protein
VRHVLPHLMPGSDAAPICTARACALQIRFRPVKVNTC